MTIFCGKVTKQCNFFLTLDLLGLDLVCYLPVVMVTAVFTVSG